MESKNIELITKMVIDAINQSEEKGNGFMVPIGVSARHVHLTQEHVETLFGPGYQLTKKKDLMGGQFASNETVTIIGLKLRAIENVRVLGPVRSATQVEVSATDAIKLGMNVPVRMSGDIAGSAPIAIVGPKGAIYLKEGRRKSEHQTKRLPRSRCQRDQRLHRQRPQATGLRRLRNQRCGRNRQKRSPSDSRRRIQ